MISSVWKPNFTWSKFVRHNIFLRKNILDNKVWQSYVLGVCGAGIWPILDEMRCFKNFVALRNSTFLRRQRTAGRELRGQVQRTRQSIGQKTHFNKKPSDQKQNKKHFKFFIFHFEYNSCRKLRLIMEFFVHVFKINRKWPKFKELLIFCYSKVKLRPYGFICII